MTDYIEPIHLPKGVLPAVQNAFRKTRWEWQFASRRSRFSFDYSFEIDKALGTRKPAAEFLSYIYPTTNLGDDIQTIAQLSFIPKQYRIKAINREQTDRYNSKPRILISNGWFLHELTAWPPASSIDPIFISVHIARRELLTPKVIDYLRRHEPIGCRDTSTLKLLNNSGIQAYFSGCLTLCLRNPYAESARKNYVVITDAQGDDSRDYPPGASSLLARLVPEEIRRTAIKVEQECLPNLRFNYLKKSLMAERLLDLYAQARLVITSRLHCALPCLALGTPVVFLHKAYEYDTRFDGLRGYLNGYGPDSRHIKIDWNAPRRSDVSAIRESLKTTLIKAVASKLSKY